ncbi:MAG: DUF1829 domain-containing protein [Clostridiales Family XIII bacterium]|jgi:hypothetical protein|nr:DUF1829 domain-containing protein [Clostridiales Family XIII bacterium]
MFMLAQSRVASVFIEDVEDFFNINDIRFTPAIQLSGKSGFQHTYDFVIPASKNSPERLIKAINNPTKEKAESVLFSWSDTRELRKNDSAMYVILNDFDRKIGQGVTDAFVQYSVAPVLWTKREASIEELSA